jgi:hypothetical protein
MCGRFAREHTRRIAARRYDREVPLPWKSIPSDHSVWRRREGMGQRLRTDGFTRKDQPSSWLGPSDATIADAD